MNNLKNAVFINKDYKDVDLPDGCIIYADPPYNKTTNGYGLKGKFDSEEFWYYAREISKTHHMYISEQNAPDDFIAIWEKKLNRQMDNSNGNRFKATEKLFVHICNK